METIAPGASDANAIEGTSKVVRRRSRTLPIGLATGREVEMRFKKRHNIFTESLLVRAVHPHRHLASEKQLQRHQFKDGPQGGCALLSAYGYATVIVCDILHDHSGWSTVNALRILNGCRHFNHGNTSSIPTLRPL